MKIEIFDNFTKLIPSKTYIKNLKNGKISQGICGKNIDANDYVDIEDEEGREFINKQFNLEMEKRLKNNRR